MLKQRVITALLLLLCVLLALFAKLTIFWQSLINVFLLLAFWEWLNLSEIKDKRIQIVSLAIFISGLWFTQSGQLPFVWLIVAACALWCVLIIFTLTNRFTVLHIRAIKLIVGMIIISVAGIAVIRFQQLAWGPLWVLCFLVCVWAADIGAYFVGRRFGKTKLAPNISPKKTVEGLLGGVVFAMLVLTPVVVYSLDETIIAWVLLMILCSVLISALGDLFISKLKRYADIKDSSQILPGHGGVLDRIDSLLSAAPFFAAGLLLLGILS